MLGANPAVCHIIPGTINKCTQEKKIIPITVTAYKIYHPLNLIFQFPSLFTFGLFKHGGPSKAQVLVITVLLTEFCSVNALERNIDVNQVENRANC